MNSGSPSPPDLTPLSLSPHRQHRSTHDSYDYDPSLRLQYNYQTSPPSIPNQNNYSSAFPVGGPQTPLKPAKASRAGLPSQWLDNQSVQAPIGEPRSLSPYNTSDLSSGGAPSPPPINGIAPQPFQSPPPQQSTPNPQQQLPTLDDDIIPNAIVIKNIPFNVKRETLLDIITSLNIPTPYAFNYHLDPAGAFRGLAFANFRAPEDADAVVAALNGFDVQGRKLRVEYKKVLQAGEKERIEREKALRRMRSMQLEKEKSQVQYDSYASPGGIGGGSMYSPPPTSYQGEHHLQNAIFQQHSSPPPVPTLPMQTNFMASPHHAPVTPKTAGQTELDMNDPATLEIYSRILLFKDDPMRDELAFSRTLTPKQRRIVHLIAQRLGVYHYSVGEGEERYAKVTRMEQEPGHVMPQRHTSQTLSRATSTYLQSAVNAGMSASLRSKKSMPDMKTLHTSAPRLTVRASNTNLREGYATIASSRRQPGSFGALFGNGGGVFGGASDVPPPVPQLPSSLASTAGLSESPHSGIVRQPRGPSEGGFSMRRTSLMNLNPEYNNGNQGLEARSHEPLEI